MNYQELENAKSTFTLHTIEKERAKSYLVRDKFVKSFNPERIKTMKLDDYVQGKGSRESFCYFIEKGLDGLGSITGATAMKFGVYYDKHNKQYVFSKKYGDNYVNAFENVRKCILELLVAGEADDYEAIKHNPISTMLKGKILSTYYPEKYLNIFGEEHLDHYLKKLDLDTKELMRKDPIYKRQALLDFKNADKDMKTWSVDMFAVFLWRHYPKRPTKEGETAVKKKDEEFDFPTPDTISFVEMERTSETDPTKKKGVPSPSVDYEKEARKYKQLGDRGEYYVYEEELKRVMKELSLTRKEAKKKVDWVARKSDAYGYDILSVNADNSPRYIEVKATRSKCGNMDFYYTANELEAAKQYGKDYFIYVVYEILTKHPKIWVINNPFIGDDTLKLQPIKYKVRLCAKKK